MRNSTDAPADTHCQRGRGERQRVTDDRRRDDGEDAAQRRDRAVAPPPPPGDHDEGCDQQLGEQEQQVAGASSTWCRP